MPVNIFTLSQSVTAVLRWGNGAGEEISLLNLHHAVQPKLDGNTKEWFLGWLMLQRVSFSNEYRFDIERRIGADVRVSLSGEAEALHDERFSKRARHF